MKLSGLRQPGKISSLTFGPACMLLVVVVQ
ncbi:MAG: hypothetical protein AW07_00325 [Candidatus Accumulibacter sp. SK-11]|nr:MAG: hypothetical protein AW07_00325 [Candidatus Accumulibacter sp. SK-11]